MKQTVFWADKSQDVVLSAKTVWPAPLTLTRAKPARLALVVLGCQIEGSDIASQSWRLDPLNKRARRICSDLLFRKDLYHTHISQCQLNYSLVTVVENVVFSRRPQQRCPFRAADRVPAGSLTSAACPHQHQGPSANQSGCVLLDFPHTPAAPLVSSPVLPPCSTSDN